MSLYFVVGVPLEDPHVKYEQNPLVNGWALGFLVKRLYFRFAPE